MNVLLECRHAGHHVDVLEDRIVQAGLAGPGGARLLLQQKDFQFQFKERFLVKLMVAMPETLPELTYFSKNPN